MGTFDKVDTKLQIELSEGKRCDFKLVEDNYEDMRLLCYGEQIAGKYYGLCVEFYSEDNKWLQSQFVRNAMEDALLNLAVFDAVSK